MERVLSSNSLRNPCLGCTEEQDIRSLEAAVLNKVREARQAGGEGAPVPLGAGAQSQQQARATPAACDEGNVRQVTTAAHLQAA